MPYIEKQYRSLRYAARAALKVMEKGRPSDPGDGEEWDRAYRLLGKAVNDCTYYNPMPRRVRKANA